MCGGIKLHAICHVLFIIITVVQLHDICNVLFIIISVDIPSRDILG
jgi:hypothetical protein